MTAFEERIWTIGIVIATIVLLYALASAILGDTHKPEQYDKLGMLILLTDEE